MKFAAYRSLDAINWSTLKHARTSLLHYRHAVKAPPREPTDAMLIGTATHCAVLEPMRLPLTVAVWEGGRRAGREWEAFCEANEGRAILRGDDYERAVAIGAAVRSHPLAARLLDRGEAEQTIRWTDRGLDCKGRVDWRAAPMVFVDLKTTRTIDMRRFSAGAWSMGTFGQLAFYRRGIAAGLGCSREAVSANVIAVENTPPFDVLVCEADADSLEAADAEIDRMLDAVREAREHDHWPGQYSERQVLRAPVYVLEDDYEFTVTESEAV